MFLELISIRKSIGKDALVGTSMFASYFFNKYG